MLGGTVFSFGVKKMFGTRERGYNTGNMLNATRLVNFLWYKFHLSFKKEE